LSAVFSSIGICVSEETCSESSIVNSSNSIEFLVSDNVINTFEFLEENSDNFVNNFNVISKSFNFIHVEVSVTFKFSLGLFNSCNSSFPVKFRSLFVLFGKNDIIFKFGLISLISFIFSLKDMNFFFRFLDESNSVSSGSNFSSDKFIHRLSKMIREIIKFFHEFTNEGGFSVLDIMRLFKFGSTLFVVYMTISSGSSFDTVFSELHEIAESFFLEKLGVGTKFGERLEFLDFSEGSWHSSGFPVVKIDLKKRYGFHSFEVFSASGDENK